jgi:hypothetical protein
MNLVTHYQGVADTLRRQDAAALAAFIEGRLSHPDVRSKLDTISKDRQADLQMADGIKRKGAMRFTVTDKGDKAEVMIYIDGAVPSADAQHFFSVSEAIYTVLFEGQMQNTGANTRGAPRVMGFECTGKLRELFDAWQTNKVTDARRMPA